MAASEEGRIHRARSADGTEIAGSVHGEGPALVLVHGGMSDGDLNWTPLLPHLSGSFTCYLLSTRGRGLSGDSPDHSPWRLVEDVVGFAESIGEPVRLMGHSSGGALVLGAATRTDAVRAVVAYEPAIPAAASPEDLGVVMEAFARMGAEIAAGRLSDAARTFFGFVANDEELPKISSSGYISSRERYAPVVLKEAQQGAQVEGPRPTDAAELAKISVPVLLLFGSRTGSWFKDGVRYASEHIPGARAQEIGDVGHFGPALHPETVAPEVLRFLTSAPGAGTPSGP